jgi:hypothetical protein
VAQLAGRRIDIADQLTTLKQNNWVDRNTMGIFLEMTVYNPNVNLFGVITLLFEKLPSGNFLPSYRLETLNALGYHGSAVLAQIISEVMFVTFTVFFILKELRNLWRLKKIYFRSFWSLVEWCLIGLSVAAIALQAYKLVAVDILLDNLKDTLAKQSISFHEVAFWVEIQQYIVGWLVFVGNFKLLQVIRYNDKVKVFICTFRKCSKDICGFGFMTLILFAGYVQAFHLLFSLFFKDYSSIVKTAESLLQITLGVFDFFALSRAQPLLGPAFFFVYVCSTSFLLINMFVSILNESFSVMRERRMEDSEDTKLLDFMISKALNLVGLGGSSKIAEKEGSKAGKYGVNLMIAGKDQWDVFDSKWPRTLSEFERVVIAQYSHFY